jgi:hypothetical protein
MTSRRLLGICFVFSVCNKFAFFYFLAMYFWDKTRIVKKVQSLYKITEKLFLLSNLKSNLEYVENQLRISHNLNLRGGFF